MLNVLSGYTTETRAWLAVWSLSPRATGIRIVPTAHGTFDVSFWLPAGAPIWKTSAVA